MLIDPVSGRAVPQSLLAQDAAHYVAFFTSAEGYKNMPEDIRAIYLSGWLDSRLNQGSNGGNREVIKAERECVRGKTLTQMTAIVDKYVEAHPETWDHPAAIQADDALESVCPALHDAFTSMWANVMAGEAPIQSKDAGRTDLKGVTGGSLHWADNQTGEYGFTLENHRLEPIKNIVCQVLFYDSGGKLIETDQVSYAGTIPAGLAKRISSKVDVSVHKLTADTYTQLSRDGKAQYGEEVRTQVEVRIVTFEAVH